MCISSITNDSLEISQLIVVRNLLVEKDFEVYSRFLFLERTKVLIASTIY